MIERSNGINYASINISREREREKENLITRRKCNREEAVSRSLSSINQRQIVSKIVCEFVRGYNNGHVEVNEQEVEI
jgi:hypothetical protein